MAGKNNGNGGRRPSKKINRTNEGVTNARKEVQAACADIIERVGGKYSLTLMETMFVQEFIVHLKPYDAYRAAYAGMRSKSQDQGKKDMGELSQNAIAVEACKLMAKPNVIAAIAQAVQERIERLQVDQDSIVIELFSLAKSNILDVGEWEGQRFRLYDSHQLTRSVAATIKSIESTTKTVIEARTGNEQITHNLKVHLHDKIGASSLLMKHLGMLIDRIQVGDSLEEFDQDPDKMTVQEKMDMLKKIKAKRFALLKGGKSG